MAKQKKAARVQTILVIEDEYFFATDLCHALREDGFEVIGPAGRKAHAAQLIETGQFDFVVMDANLHGIVIFDIADRLVEMDIPFMFVTGYFETEIPSRFAKVPFMSKPVPGDRLAVEVKRLVDVLDRS